MKKASVSLLASAALLLSTNILAQSTKLQQKCYKDGVKVLNNDAYPEIPTAERSHTWEPLKEQDVAWKKRVWRIIDTKTDNELLSDAKLGASLLKVLYTGAAKELYPAYFDDKFQRALPQKYATAIMRTDELMPITSYQIKEDWIMTKDGKIHVRIVSITPLMQDIKSTEGKELTGFTFFYPDLRKHFYGYKISGENVTDLEEVFEARAFSSRIIKTSSDLNAEQADIINNLH